MVQNLTENCQKITFRWERYSSYTKLFRYIACVIKIVKNWVLSEDLKTAEDLLILTAQGYVQPRVQYFKRKQRTTNK